MKKTCTYCRQSFDISAEDLAFLEKVSPEIGGIKQQIPPPTLCPECRRQRRMSWRNEKRLYHRKCDLTGKQILSVYSPDKPFTVYEHHEWYKADWDPLSYGKDFDFSKPFFEQFDALHHSCPIRSMNSQAESVNSDYTNLGTRNKNCYLIFAATGNEDCYYSMYIQRSRNCIDCFFVFDCEWCYECIDCYGCSRLRRSQYCENCHDSFFLYDCHGCTDCFGCAGLVKKQYCIFNQQYSKEEYEKMIGDIRGSRETFAAAGKKFDQLKLTVPHKATAGISNENVTGDHVSFSKNAFSCFDCTYLEDCKNCTWLHQSKDCQDCYAWGLTGELGYENHLCGEKFYNVQFTESCWNNVRNLLYCRYCLDGTSDCFGCVSLVRRQYCVLNKQYTKDEYERLVPKIIEHMRGTKEWGEFFPTHLSPYGYNETVAQEYFPMSEEEVKAKNWKWRPEDASQEKYLGPHAEIPASIDDAGDDVTEKIYHCEITGKPYKIIPQELAFYREMRIPLPTKCFDQRHVERRDKRNPRKLWKRSCAKCEKEIQTSYAPDRPEIVFCEDCYRKEVY